MKTGQHAWMWRDGSACNGKRDVPYFLDSSEFSSAHLLSKGHRERHLPLRVFGAREGADGQREHLVSQALLVSFAPTFCALYTWGVWCAPVPCFPVRMCHDGAKLSSSWVISYFCESFLHSSVVLVSARNLHLYLPVDWGMSSLAARPDFLYSL